MEQPLEAVAQNGQRRAPGPAQIAAGALCGGASLIIFLIALLGNGASQTALLVGVLLIVAALLALLVGAGLLVWAYRAFFAGGWGVALWLGVALLALLLPAALPSTRLGSAVGEVASAWGVAAVLALGPTLWLYLRRTDHGLRVVALTFLALVWLLYSLGQALGWDALLHSLVVGGAGPAAAPIQLLLCLAIWVFFVAPLAFVWQTIVLLRRESRGVTAVLDAPLSDSSVGQQEKGDGRI